MGEVIKLNRRIGTLTTYSVPIVAILLLGFVLNVTNPLQSGPLIILAVFVLIYVVLVGVLAALLYLCAAIIRMLNSSYNFSLRRAYYVVSIVALAPVLFIALNTLGQLDWLEIILILSLIVLGCFYALRRSKK